MNNNVLLVFLSKVTLIFGYWKLEHKEMLQSL